MAASLAFHAAVWFPAALCVSDMEAHGVKLDVAACEQGEREQETLRDEYAVRLNDWAGREVLWTSADQRADYLYDERGWRVPELCGSVRSVKKTQRGKRPTDEYALIQLARKAKGYDKEMLRQYVGYPDIKEREHEPSFKLHEKCRKFFALGPKHVSLDGRVHPQLAATTETGRLSSKNPNLQNQPPEARVAFLAEEGNVLLARDYSGLEWRILAHILAFCYDDYSLVDDIKNGVDPHDATAARMSAIVDREVSRAAAKILNYSVNYGKTEHGLAIQLDIPIAEARVLLDAFYAGNPGIERWHRDCVAFARENGLCYTLLGRHRYLNFAGNKWAQSRTERLAMNHPIQGSATDIMLAATLKVSERFNEKLRALGSRLLLNVHDEFVFEVPRENVEEVSQEVDHQMVNAIYAHRPDFKCPLETSGGWGVRWSECK